MLLAVQVVEVRRVVDVRAEEDAVGVAHAHGGLRRLLRAAHAVAGALAPLLRDALLDDLEHVVAACHRLGGLEARHLARRVEALEAVGCRLPVEAADAAVLEEPLERAHVALVRGAPERAPSIIRLLIRVEVFEERARLGPRLEQDLDDAEVVAAARREERRLAPVAPLVHVELRRVGPAQQQLHDADLAVVARVEEGRLAAVRKVDLGLIFI